MSERNHVYIAAETHANAAMQKLYGLEPFIHERVRLTIMESYCAAYAAAMTHAKQIMSPPQSGVGVIQ